MHYLHYTIGEAIAAVGGAVLYALVLKPVVAKVYAKLVGAEKAVVAKVENVKKAL